MEELEEFLKEVIRDSKELKSGEYIITKLTQPLTYNGTMQITAIKAVPYLGIYN